MNSRWNIDGPLSMTEIPEEFAEFVSEKQNQLLGNVLTSAAASVVLANGAALIAGDLSMAVFAETIQTQIPLLALTAVASVLAK